MVRNQPVSACFKCYHLEATGAKSLRLWSNERALELSSCRSLLEVYRQATDMVEDHRGQAPPPVSMQLWFDNRCNLACRMCNGHFSSRIESDLVQSRWNPTATSASYITSLFPGEDGTEKRWEFHSLFRTYRKRCLTVPEAGKTISVPATPFPVSEVYICGELSGRDPKELEITLDGKSVLLDVIRDRHWSRRISVYHQAISSEVAVTIRVRPPSNKLRISHVALQMSAPIKQAKPESPDLCASLPAGDGSRESSFSQLIPSPERMREICLAGGEPMMNPETLRLLQHLEQGGKLDSTGIFMHTNGTIFNRRIVELLKKFRWAALGFSIDGLGSLFEYIRYPANWERTWNCILEHRAAGLHVEIQPCIQAYNVFGTVELLRFCDQQGIRYSLNNVLRLPRFLSLNLLPAVVLEKARLEWEQYYTSECRSENQSQVKAILSALSLPPAGDAPALQEEFIAFTNDLDRDRRQVLSVAEPRLYQELTDAGLQFEGKYRFAAASA